MEWPSAAHSFSFEHYDDDRAALFPTQEWNLGTDKVLLLL